MASIVTNNHRIYNADQTKRVLSLTSDALYLAMGRDDDRPWTLEPTPDAVVDSVRTEIDLRNDVIFFKKLPQSSIHPVTRRIDWVSGTIYDHFDDTIDMFAPDVDFYVMTDEFNVYKCIDNFGGIASTIKPTGTALNVVEYADFYKWKYMYTISGADVFSYLTDLHMPVSTLIADDNSTQWEVQTSAGAATGIERIEIINGGTGYTGSVPEVVFTTTTGDNTAEATAVADVSGVITHITIDVPGTDYSDCTITFNGGSGNDDVTARAILGPIGGHGLDAVKELSDGASMFRVALVGDEDDKFPNADDETYRQLSVWNDVLTDQTVKRLAIGTHNNVAFSGGELLRGATSNATATVKLWDQERDILWAETVAGTFLLSESVTGESSAATGTILTSSDAELPATEGAYAAGGINTSSGNILYIENRGKITRSETNNEEFRFVIQF